MKIAYLLSVYKDPILLGRMIKALNVEGDTWFFIHVDLKSKLEDFRNAIPSHSVNISFIQKRYWIQWGGFNQVLYQKELLRNCILSGIVFDRVFILTGQDYPLMSNAKIQEKLKQNPNKEWITGLDISNITYPKKIRSKIVLYHFFRDMKYTPYKIKKIFSGGSRIIMKVLPFRKKPYLMVNGQRWDVFQSSSYMCLTFNLCRYLLKQMDENRKVMKYFKYSFVPEEMVIPTIIFNSPFKKNCTLYAKGTYDGLISLSSITYFHYDGYISVFRLKDYEELKNCGMMFARKFSTGVSDSLMDRLDHEHGIN